MHGLEDLLVPGLRCDPEYCHPEYRHSTDTGAISGGGATARGAVVNDIVGAGKTWPSTGRYGDIDGGVGLMGVQWHGRRDGVEEEVGMVGESWDVNWDINYM